MANYRVIPKIQHYEGKKVIATQYNDTCMRVDLRLEDGTFVSIPDTYSVLCGGRIEKELELMMNWAGISDDKITVSIEEDTPKELEFDFDKIRKIMEM